MLKLILRVLSERMFRDRREVIWGRGDFKETQDICDKLLDEAWGHFTCAHAYDCNIDYIERVQRMVKLASNAEAGFNGDLHASPYYKEAIKLEKGRTLSELVTMTDIMKRNALENYERMGFVRWTSKYRYSLNEAMRNHDSFRSNNGTLSGDDFFRQCKFYIHLIEKLKKTDDFFDKNYTIKTVAKLIAKITAIFIAILAAAASVATIYSYNETKLSHDSGDVKSEIHRNVERTYDDHRTSPLRL